MVGEEGMVPTEEEAVGEEDLVGVAAVVVVMEPRDMVPLPLG